MDVERLKVDESLWPEWATHAGRDGKRRVCWYADIDDNGNAVHPDGYRFKYSGTRIPVCRNLGKVSHFDLIPRPTKTEWTPERQAVKTLESMGYTYCGGEYWKPPIGEKPRWLETEWVDGLPPIGELCQAKPPIWYSDAQLKVLCHDEGNVVCRVLDGDKIGSLVELVPNEIRPIQTPEQRQREELAMVIDNALCSDNTPYHLADAILQWMKDKEK